MLGAKVALPVKVLDPTTPLTRPFQWIVNVAGVVRLERSVQVTGTLGAKVPVRLPPRIFTTPSVVVQSVSLPLVADGLVAPPDSVRRGEKVTVAEKSQVTEPGASPR